MLKSYVEFKSSLFPPCSENPEEWDGAIWGRALAQFLDEKLKQQGVPAAGIHAEDWGYCVNFEAPFHDDIWLGCGRYEEYENGYLVMVEPKNPVIKKWFAADIDLTEQLLQLTVALAQILDNEPHIHDVKWWSAAEFEKR